jgi:hypothetical protein
VGFNPPSSCGEKSKTSFLKKRSKKLLLFGVRGLLRMVHVYQLAKVFCFFFFKKEVFLSFFYCGVPTVKHPSVALVGAGEIVQAI